MSLRDLAEQLADEVMVIIECPGADGGEFYITGGHVDLLTAIQRGGGPGSRWKYPPGDVLHIWLFEHGDDLTFDTIEQPQSIPCTAIVEADPGLMTQIGPNTFVIPHGKPQ